MSAPSMFSRAVLALSLMIGFYLLAIVVAVLLFAVPYFTVAYMNFVSLKLTLGCVLGGLAILVSLVPRPHRFHPPGPELAREDHPRLFEQIEEVAAATGQSMPREVYLDTEVNAWVAERGGFLGIGSRRVMGLGLPLMQVITVPQLRAVLAHEFGHYHGGDTRLGVFVYQIRAAIGRTIENTGGSAVNGLFVWYGNWFLRVTHAVSRAQERTADALAARVAGARELAGGLLAVRRAGLSFRAFWNTEVVDVLEARRRVPVLSGFAQFLAAPRIHGELDELLAQPEEADPYDTHPPLDERLEALGGAPDAAEGPLAITLFGDPGAAEQQYLDMTAGPQTQSFAEIEWEDVGQAVALPGMRRFVDSQRAALAGVTAGDLPRIAAAPQDLAQRLAIPAQLGSLENRVRLAANVVGAGLAIVLAERGFKVLSLPGCPIELVGPDGSDDRLLPFDVFGELASGTVPAETWTARCRAWGIADVEFAAVAAAGAGAAA